MRKSKKDFTNFFGKIKVPDRPDVSILLHRAFYFNRFLCAIYQIMDNSERLTGLKDVTSVRHMVQACDFWSGHSIANTFLDRSDFALNFNTTEERDAAIPILKSLCKELRITCGKYDPMNGWGRCYDGRPFPDITIEPCHRILTGEQYRRRYVDMTPEQVMHMAFFKDIRAEFEHDKKQLEEWKRTHVAV